VVDVARVDVGPVIEQQGGDLDISGEMEWKLPVAASCVDELRINGQELSDAVDFPKPRGGMDIDGCAASDEVVRKLAAG